MDWREALAIVKPADRVCWLCSDDNPNAEQREQYRNLMVRQAAGETDPSPPPVSPPAPPAAPAARPCCGQSLDVFYTM
jgi:hypothetical protein